MKSNHKWRWHTHWAQGLGLVLLGLSLFWPRTLAAAPRPTELQGVAYGPEAADRLLAALGDPSEPARLDAARALGRLGTEAAVEPLGAMLLQGSGAEISVAAEALGRIASPGAIDQLLATLADEGLTSRRHAAMAALEAMGEPAVGPLVAMLVSEDATARHNAAEMLGWIGSPSAAGALVTALIDESVQVRCRAAWALGEIRDRRSQEALSATEGQAPALN